MSPLQKLPSELLSSIALFLGGRSTYGKQKDKLGDLLSLRSASKAGEEAVRLAAKDHSMCEAIRFSSSSQQVTARGIATVGRLFAGGARELDYTGNYHKGYNGPHPVDVVTPLRDLVVQHTRGRLTNLHISFSAITATALLDMCRASPLLTRLCAYGPNLSQHLKSQMDEFALMVSTACPLLTQVAIPTHLGSKAESYQMHFPKTECICLQSGLSDYTYEPTRYDRIELSAMQCVNAEEIDLSACEVTPDLARVLTRAPLSRVTCLNLEGKVTEVEPATILQLAAGMEALTSVCLPDTLTHTPGFYTSLARARPTLTSIWFGDENSSTIDDACIAAICENLALERLYIDGNRTLTPRVIDIILGSKTAQTLNDANFYRVDAFTSANILRLARGCPKLVDLCWYVDGLSPLADGNGQNVEDLTELLESRAKQSSEYTYFEVDDVFDHFGPWKPDSHHYKSTTYSQHPPGPQ